LCAAFIAAIIVAQFQGLQVGIINHWRAEEDDAKKEDQDNDTHIGNPLAANPKIQINFKINN
jgi:hypothetical protein